MIAIIGQTLDRMRACVRNGDDDKSEEFDVKKRSCQGCVICPFLFDSLFEGVLLLALHWFSEDSDIITDPVYLREPRARFGPETTIDNMRYVVFGMLCTYECAPCRRQHRD